MIGIPGQVVGLTLLLSPSHGGDGGSKPLETANCINNFSLLVSSSSYFNSPVWKEARQGHALVGGEDFFRKRAECLLLRTMFFARDLRTAIAVLSMFRIRNVFKGKDGLCGH
jgi:hypothetical protein